MAQENVFLFAPNLIGYIRVILGLLSFYLMPSSPWPAVSCYLLSFLLDEVDGSVARAMDQCSRFGAMLDMLTDRCATMCLLVNLSLLYPSYTFLFQLSMCLDISGHWLYMHSSSIKGSTSHKTIDLSGNPVLRVYYTSWTFLCVMCYGNELFFCLLYLLHHLQEPAAWFYWLLALCGIICLLKTFINLMHLVTAAQDIAALDAADREKRQ
ncbi:CDP-diacylglycerol--inositol 3-phosphatidyltransferase-like [Antennarius striatus]|uniref:CDP-diacylglycerol--inositol 3-phosphatidyltransferase-like n=1 Tax=Antennarius striatus TaxID=241820 RepID=UPI0035B1CED1